MIYCYQNLTVRSELKIIELHHMEIREAVNRHTSAVLTGICGPDESGDAAGQKITISDGENGVIFAGRICGLEQYRSGGVVGFELRASSFSSLMDCSRLTRVVQNQDRSYRELIELILKSYPSASLNGGTSLDSKLPPLVVQEHETDWEFIKRLALQMGECVSPDSASEQIQLSIGAAGGKEELTGINDWKKTFQPEKGKELLYIKMRRRHSPGSMLCFQGKWYCVEACDCRLARGEIFYHLQLVQGDGRQTASRECLAQEGIRLGAYVREVNRNQFRLHFENEAFSGGGGFPWFPYSGEVNNETGFHMSPQGAEVEVVCTDLYGSSAVVVGAMRRTQEKKAAGSVADKTMKNEQGIGFGLEDAKAGMWAGESNQIQFLADGTIVLEAEQITLEAKGNLVLGSYKGHISIEAERNMSIVSGRDGCGQMLFDTGGNIRCKSTRGLQYKSGTLPTGKSRASSKKVEKGLKESTMAMAGTEFLAQSIEGREAGLEGNYIKTTLLEDDERLFCAFSYGENKNGG